MGVFLHNARSRVRLRARCEVAASRIGADVRFEIDELSVQVILMDKIVYSRYKDALGWAARQ